MPTGISRMYISVKLLNGFKESLIYKVPDSWASKPLEGTLIRVPLQKRYEFAFVEKSFKQFDSSISYAIKEASDRDIIPIDEHYLPFLEKLSSYYAVDKLTFLRRLKHFLTEKEHRSYIQEPDTESERVIPTLTEVQDAIVQAIAPQITKGEYFPSLLHGVTGSGKTEVYKKLLMQCCDEGKSSILLLPEVSLAVRFAHLLKQQLPSSVALFNFHSATSVPEKRALWSHLMAQKPAIILGVHLPLLLPIPNLGLIIIDEEHDVGYQEKRHPKVYTKEAALIRAQVASVPLLAGSATPSISSLYNVAHKGWHKFELKKRFSGAFPKISIVKLTTDRPRASFWISSELEKALAEQLIKKEQTILFLNRRGYSFFVQCTSCGEVPHCEQCAVSLTLHKDTILRCHYCSYHITTPTECHSCKGTAFLKKGIGTQQVVSILEKIFPTARIARADLDTTVNKKQWTETVQRFEAGEIDILIGTQTITKGYHFPKVTLVGILWADINLSIPMYNAAEVTLQQLIQVAGRAGRQSAESQVIVQTMITHSLFDYLNEQDYTDFFDSEIKKRSEVGYPPLVRFAEIECKHANLQTVEDDAHKLVQALKRSAIFKNKELTILGPSEPPVAKIKNVHARKIYIKAQTIGAIIETYTSIDKKAFSSSLYFTPNPLSS